MLTSCSSQSRGTSWFCSLLFIIAMIPLGQIIGYFAFSFHCYADNTQLYLMTKFSSSLFNCLVNMKTWLIIQLSSPKPLLQKVSAFLRDIDGGFISPSPNVCNLGIFLDPSYFGRTSNPSLNLPSTPLRTSLNSSHHILLQLKPSFLLSVLPAWTFATDGLPIKTLDRLQSLQNSHPL